jgi:hypothetical protein
LFPETKGWVKSSRFRVREWPKIPNWERSMETEGRVVTGKSDCIEANIRYYVMLKTNEIPNKSVGNN